jgi:hypothetical protein
MESYAYAAMIGAGKTDDFKRMLAEINGGARRAEFAAFAKKAGISRIRVWIQPTPIGDMAIGLYEGPNASDWLKTVFESKAPVASWFRGRISEIHEVNARSGDIPSSSQQAIDLNL